MNVFRLVGDFSHLLAIIILLFNICMTRSCAGISGRSQILFGLVYTTRYFDLISYFISTYNTLMKIIFIGTSLVTVYLIYYKFKATYDRDHDHFRAEFLVIPVLILAFIVNHDFSFLEIMWTFSIYLESIAIIPQLFMISKTGEAKTIILHYLFCLVSYKSFYILNWVYRYYVEGFYDVIAIVAGYVQVTLYYYFFFHYKYIWKQSLLPVTIKDQNIQKSKEQALDKWSPSPTTVSDKSYQIHHLNFQKDKNSVIFQILTDFIKENCTTQDFICTDASKSQDSIRISIISYDLIFPYDPSTANLADLSLNSNFLTEAFAPHQVINQLSEQKQKFIVLSANKSALSSVALIHNNKSCPIILEIHKTLQSCNNSYCDIALILMPGLDSFFSTNESAKQLEN